MLPYVDFIDGPFGYLFRKVTDGAVGVVLSTDGFWVHDKNVSSTKVITTKDLFMALVL